MIRITSYGQGMIKWVPRTHFDNRPNIESKNLNVTTYPYVTNQLAPRLLEQANNNDDLAWKKSSDMNPINIDKESEPLSLMKTSTFVAYCKKTIQC